MKKIIRMSNLIDIGNTYEHVDALWWAENDTVPSFAKFQKFYSDTMVWDRWVIDNVDTMMLDSKEMPKNDRLTIRQVVGRLKKHNDVFVSYTISSVDNTKTEIESFQLRYSVTSKFNLQEFERELALVKRSKERKSQVYMVVNQGRGLDLIDFDIEVPILDIALNYGEEWEAKHNNLIEVLTEKKKKGIALLHGLPGTGKSMYIRHLISILSEIKTVIYLPNQLIPSITDPSFIPLMSDHAGALLVIEDGDDAIRSRKSGGNTVDKLLNLADGILSDFLGMQILCTFNSDITTIDEALMRKGRLILKHKFEKLSKENAQVLSDKLGFTNKITQDMTLAEIYNQDDKFSDISENKTKLGFGK